MLKAPLPLLNDPEGDHLPASLPFTVDAHVHFFPDHLFAAVCQWFDQFGWPIRYRLNSPEIIKSIIRSMKTNKNMSNTINRVFS